jgi:hypothetical protein
LNTALLIASLASATLSVRERATRAPAAFPASSRYSTLSANVAEVSPFPAAPSPSRVRAR